MPDGLCWKCKDTVERLGDKNVLVLWADGILHCHHEQKDKPRCWCERNDNVKVGGHVVWRTIDWERDVPMNFCPECGRKL